MMNSQTPGHGAVRAARDPLVTVTCIVVLLVALGALAAGLNGLRTGLAEAARAGDAQQSAYTDGEAAHVTLTNLNPFAVESCFRAVVSSATASAGAPAVSVTVCSGVMKPRTTVALSAPYRVHAVSKLCSSEPDRLGMTHLDWSRCSFELEAVK